MKPTTYFTDDHAASMTLRDYFAAKAMQGYMNDCFDMSKAERAEAAYAMADAMLGARECV